MGKTRVNFKDLPTLKKTESDSYWPQRVEIEELDPVMDWFSEENLFSFFKDYIKNMEGSENYFQINSFLEGSPSPCDFSLPSSPENLFDTLGSLETSIRLTNVHKFIGPVKEFCHASFAKSGHPMVCNMYITPGKTSNCFLFHSDYQDNIIQQLKGSKNWFFPLDKDAKGLRLQPRGPFSQHFEDIYSLVIDQGQTMFFGNSVVHKAMATEEDISVHLTYAIFRRTKMDLRDFLVSKAFGHQSALLAEGVGDKNDMKEMTNSFINKLSQIDSEKLIDDYLQLIEKENLRILKKGRRY